MMSASPWTDILRNLFSVPTPTRNDCGYEGRYDLEDTTRMCGQGPAEGEGPCDYPECCPLKNVCPLLAHEQHTVETT